MRKSHVGKTGVLNIALSGNACDGTDKTVEVTVEAVKWNPLFLEYSDRKQPRTLVPGWLLLGG